MGNKIKIYFSMVLQSVFNHNVEIASHMYQEVQPSANYKNMLALWSRFKVVHPQVATKFELMLSLEETIE
jgi:lipoate synthase